MKKFFVFTLLFCFTICYSNAQTFCEASANFNQLRKKDPRTYQDYINYEGSIRKYVDSVKKLPLQQGRLRAPNNLIVIPVVVHILYPNGQAIGVGNNITDAQIQSQLDVLNEDFRRTNADRVNTPAMFVGVASDLQIEFRLACKDPNGTPTNGITRTATSTTSFTSYTIKFTGYGGQDGWSGNKYLNIWVGNVGGGVLGNGTFPWEYYQKPEQDGVVINTANFGRIGNLTPNRNLGRTATHEVGHWLGLYHIWGDDLGTCDGSDACEDTPNQFNFTVDCQQYSTACSDHEMFMNFMDNTIDGCKNIFTNDQKGRTRGAFALDARADFLHNTFGIISPQLTTNGICVGQQLTFTVSNPLCLATSWEVAGPLSIISGQSTEQVTVQATGSGDVTLKAIGGTLYTDEVHLLIGVPTGTVAIYGVGDGATVCKGSGFNVTSDRGGNIQWTVLGGQILSGQGSPEIFIRLNNTPGDGFYIEARELNDCGLSNILGTKVGTIGDCDGGDVISKTTTPKGNNTNPTKGTKQNAISRTKPSNPSTYSTTKPISQGYAKNGSNKRSFEIKVSPTPTRNILFVESVNQSSTIKQVLIFDKMKALRKTFDYKGMSSKVALDVSSLTPDIYLVQVYDGRNWKTEKIFKQ